MTDFELRQYRCLVKEEKLLESELRQEIDKYEQSALNYANVRTAKTYRFDDIVCDKVVNVIDLEQELKCALIRRKKRRMQIEKFLNCVDDAEIRLVLRLRYVHGKSWLRIGMELGYDGSWARKKALRYLKKIASKPKKPDVV